MVFFIELGTPRGLDWPSRPSYLDCTREVTHAATGTHFAAAFVRGAPNCFLDSIFPPSTIFRQIYIFTFLQNYTLSFLLFLLLLLLFALL